MSKETTTAVAVVEPRRNIVPMTFNDIQAIGKAFQESGMFGCTQQGQGMVIAMTCQMQGITPLEFCETYHIINGKPSMRSDAMLARLLELGGSYEIIARDADRAAIKASFKGASGTFTLSWAEAQLEPFAKGKDGKVKDNYSTPRRRMQMLWARVVSDAVRTVCPLVNRGSYTPEEVEDFAEPVAPQQGKVIAPPVIQLESPAPPKASEADAAPAQPSPFAEAKPEVVTPEVMDYSIVPTGKLKGKKWSELNETQLQFVVGKEIAGFAPEHRAAAKLELESRGGVK